MIDRERPRQRPRRRAVMRQNWRDLLFLHWPVRPEFLRPFVPPQLELDVFDGTAFIGLVPFTMTGVRPIGFPPVWGLSSFHETNVRTYVHHAGRNPGVWFFNLEAANSIAVHLARRFFHLPYHHARMFLERERAPGATKAATVLYAGVRRWPGPLPASYAIRATPTELVKPLQAGSLEDFLIERYILYAVGNDRLYEGRVHHTPYPIRNAKIHSVDETLLAAAGIERPNIAPLAHYSSGVNVEVFALQ